MEIPLEPRASEALTFQQYGPQPEIDGVFVHPLRKHQDLNGSFMEYLRITGGQVEGLPIDFDLRQISFSATSAGRINAFHVHPKIAQDELWLVTSGKLLVWLVDTRAGSSTQGARRSYILSGEQPAMLYIPSGVAHGYKAGHEGALLVYAMNAQFDASDPNEGRLPWDWFGEELWEDDRG